MQPPRLFLLTLGALTLSAPNGPAANTTLAPDVPSPQPTPER
jgi:hypothetical protein